MIAKLPVSEIVFRHDNETRLIKSVKPGICMFCRDTQGPIGEGLFVSIELFQIRCHRLGGRTKEMAKLRSHIEFLFRGEVFLLLARAQTEKSRVSGRRALRICSLRNVTKQLAQKRIALRNRAL